MYWFIRAPYKSLPNLGVAEASEPQCTWGCFGASFRWCKVLTLSKHPMELWSFLENPKDCAKWPLKSSKIPKPEVVQYFPFQEVLRSCKTYMATQLCSHSCLLAKRYAWGFSSPWERIVLACTVPKFKQPRLNCKIWILCPTFPNYINLTISPPLQFGCVSKWVIPKTMLTETKTAVLCRAHLSWYIGTSLKLAMTASTGRRRRPPPSKYSCCFSPEPRCGAAPEAWLSHMVPGVWDDDGPVWFGIWVFPKIGVPPNHPF